MINSFVELTFEGLPHILFLNCLNKYFIYDWIPIYLILFYFTFYYSTSC